MVRTAKTIAVGTSATDALRDTAEWGQAIVTMVSDAAELQEALGTGTMTSGTDDAADGDE